MAVGWVILFIAIAGLVGGLLNAFFTAEGFILSRVDTLPEPSSADSEAHAC
jgi:hypothetical protein